MHTHEPAWHLRMNRVVCRSGLLETHLSIGCVKVQFGNDEAGLRHIVSRVAEDIYCAHRPIGEPQRVEGAEVDRLLSGEETASGFVLFSTEADFSGGVVQPPAGFENIITRIVERRAVAVDATIEGCCSKAPEENLLRPDK